MPDDGADRVAATALYQAERADLSNIFGQALALVSIALAYMGTALAVLVTRGTKGTGAWIMWFPLPAMMVISFHVVLTSLVFAHNVSAKTLEQELTAIAGFTAQEAAAIGVRAGTAVTDLTRQLSTRARYPLAGATVVSYGGVLAIVGSFMYYCLHAASRYGWAWTWALGLYIFIIICIAASWNYVFRLDEKALAR